MIGTSSTTQKMKLFFNGHSLTLGLLWLWLREFTLTGSKEMELHELALRNLPAGKFVRFDKIETMSGEMRECVVWRFGDDYCGDVRTAYFSNYDGEYFGECLR